MSVITVKYGLTCFSSHVNAIHHSHVNLIRMLRFQMWSHLNLFNMISFYTWSHVITCDHMRTRVMTRVKACGFCKGGPIGSLWYVVSVPLAFAIHLYTNAPFYNSTVLLIKITEHMKISLFRRVEQERTACVCSRKTTWRRKFVDIWTSTNDFSLTYNELDSQTSGAI